MLDSLCCLRESTNTRGFALIFTTDIHNTRNAFQAQTERAGQTGSGRERERERERGEGVWERERAACQSYYKICLCFIKNLRLASTAGNEH